MKSNEGLCILCKENYVEDEIHSVCGVKFMIFIGKKLYDYVKEKHEMFETI